MSRGLGWTLGGAFAGIGVLFFTVWSGSADSASMAAVMFAVSSVMFATTEATQGRKTPCPDKARHQASTDGSPGA